MPKIDRTGGSPPDKPDIEPDTAPEEHATGDAGPDMPEDPESQTAPAPVAAADTGTPPEREPAPAPIEAPTGPLLIGSSLAEGDDVATVLYYGDPGSTKTTSALSLANLGQTVLINVEAGAKRIPLRQRGIDLSRIEQWPPADKNPSYITFERLEQEVYEPARQRLEQDPDAIVGFAVDSFSELTRRLLDEVTTTAAQKAARTGKTRDPFQVDLADHGTTSQMMRTLLRRFRDLGVHLAITALERRDIDSDTGKVKYGPAVGPAIANDTMGLVDVVMYTTIEQVGPEGETEEFAIGTCRPTTTRNAKDRFGVLPPRMVDPTMERIIKYLRGELTRETDPRQLAIKDALRRATDAAAKTTIAA